MSPFDTGIVSFSLSGGWIADLVLRGSVLLVVALAMLALARHRSAAQRHLIGMAGMIAMPLLPLAMWWMPAGFGVLPSFFAYATQPVMAGGGGASMAGSVPTWMVWVLGSWGVVGLVLAARAWIASRRLDDFFSGGSTSERTEAASEVARQRMGLAVAPQIRLSDAVDVPITFGLLVPKILLPSEAVSWDEDRLSWVLLHEQAHIARRDPAAQAVTLAICCLFWWQPLVWRLSRRLEIECEHAADDLVLTHRDDAVGYARLLVDIAESLRGRPLSAYGLPMARPSQLRTRLQAMFDSDIDRRRSNPRQALMAMGALGILLIPLAALPRNAVAGETEEVAPASPWTSEASTGHGHGSDRGHASGHEHTSDRGNGHRGSGRQWGHASTASGHASRDHRSSHRSRQGHARSRQGHSGSGHGAGGHRGSSPPDS